MTGIASASRDAFHRLACNGPGRMILKTFTDRFRDACAVEAAFGEQLRRITVIDEAIGEAQL